MISPSETYFASTPVIAMKSNGCLRFPGCRRAGGGGRPICSKRPRIVPRMRPNQDVARTLAKSSAPSHQCRMRTTRAGYPSSRVVSGGLGGAFARERSVEIPGQADSAELPAGVRRKEVAVASAGVAARRNTRGAAQDELVAHELAVVLSQGPGRRAVAGIARIAARCPLPDITVQLKKAPPVGHGAH